MMFVVRTSTRAIVHLSVILLSPAVVFSRANSSPFTEEVYVSFFFYSMIEHIAFNHLVVSSGRFFKFLERRPRISLDTFSAILVPCSELRPLRNRPSRSVPPFPPFPPVALSNVIQVRNPCRGGDFSDLHFFNFILFDDQMKRSRKFLRHPTPAFHYVIYSFNVSFRHVTLDEFLPPVDFWSESRRLLSISLGGPASATPVPSSAFC